MISRLGKFEIKEELGHGGMGVVYRAWDPLMERWVALKTIIADKATREDFIRRFRREAVSAGRLNHPNIVTIYEFAEQDDLCYIAMEFLEGSNLESLLSSPRWELQFNVFRKLDILIQVCRGLAFAHRHEVIHRDVKPANIVLVPDGTAKLVDFGIARLADNTGGTQNMLIGTAPYLSPEQIQGELYDERVDIFALGVVAFRMFTGQFPFPGENTATVFNNILHNPVPRLSDYTPDLPAELELIIQTSLAKDRNQRYRSMEEMGMEFQRLLRSLNAGLITAHVEEAGRVLESDPNRARDLVRKVLDLEPGHEVATQLWRKVQDLLQREQNQKKVRAFVEEGLSFFQKANWGRALECFEQGLKIEPTHEILLTYRTTALKEQQKSEEVSKALKVARSLWARQERVDARQKLEQVLQQYPDSTEALTLLRELESEEDLGRRQEEIQQSVKYAQDAIDARQWKDALGWLKMALDLDPQNPELQRLREKVSRSQEEADRQKALADQIAGVRARIDQGDWQVALQKIQAALQVFPEDPALLQFRARCEQALHSAGVQEQAAAAAAGATSEAGVEEAGFSSQTQLRGKKRKKGNAARKRGRTEPEAGPPAPGASPAAEVGMAATVTRHPTPAPIPPPTPIGAARPPAVVPVLDDTKISGEIPHPKPSAGPGRTLLYVAGGTLLSLLLVIGWAAYKGSTPSAPSGGASPQAAILVDILPWAEVKEVRDLATGKTLPLTGQTPLRMVVPPGDYRLVLTNPKFDTLETSVKVQAGEEKVVRQAFPRFDPLKVLDAYGQE